MAEEAAQAVREALTGCEAIPDEIRDYVLDTATGLLDDMLVLPPPVCPDFCRMLALCRTSGKIVSPPCSGSSR